MDVFCFFVFGVVLLLGAFLLGAFLLGAFLLGAFLLGAFLLGAFLLGAFGTNKKRIGCLFSGVFFLVSVFDRR